MVEPLVMPFVVVVRDELADGATPRALADQDPALEAGFLDGAHEALRVGANSIGRCNSFREYIRRRPVAECLAGPRVVLPPPPFDQDYAWVILPLDFNAH